MIYISSIEIIPFNIYLFLEYIYFQIPVSIFLRWRKERIRVLIIYLNNIIIIIKID